MAAVARSAVQRLHRFHSSLSEFGYRVHTVTEYDAMYEFSCRRYESALEISSKFIDEVLTDAENDINNEIVYNVFVAKHPFLILVDDEAVSVFGLRLLIDVEHVRQLRKQLCDHNYLNVVSMRSVVYVKYLKIQCLFKLQSSPPVIERELKDIEHLCHRATRYELYSPLMRFIHQKARRYTSEYRKY